MEFALLRAGRGNRPDERFGENVRGASAQGIAVGVFHTLGSENRSGALAEADRLLRQIQPYRERIRLWVCCRAERELFGDPRQAAGVLQAFLRRVQAAGYSPMLGASPELLRWIPDGGRSFPLWLLFWNVPEYRAMQFCPRIWQYDSGFAGGTERRIPLNRGYFGCRLPDLT